METLIKINLDEILKKEKYIAVDIGCGSKKKEGRIGVDKVDLPQIDIIADIENGLEFFPDGSVDEIHCRSVLEHVTNFEFILREMLRIIKKEGEIHIFVPHFSNPHYYSDPTHIRFFGLYTFYYFTDTEHQLRRKVPNFYSDIRLRILSQKLVFRSTFKLINPIKKAFGWLINRSKLIQEYYEENLVYIFPAHGIEMIMGHVD